MVEIDTREKLAAWLRKQPREVARILADRWTLRALPVVAMYQSDLLSELILPSFRVVAASWGGVEYPDHDLEQPFTAAKTAAKRAFAAAAQASLAADAILGPRGADEAMIRKGFTFAAQAFAGAAADDSEGRAFAAKSGAETLAAAANEAAAATFWSAISADATHRERGVAASDIAGLPLWPSDPPVELRSLWRDLKAKLHAGKQDWQVWTTWYDDRLDGRVRDVDHELAYVWIEETLWDQGSAVVNAEIKRQIEACGATTETSRVVRPQPPPPVRPAFKGFFSYSHSDAEVDPNIVEAFTSQLERRVAASLVNATFKIWRDTDNLRAGDYWDESIKAEIKSVDVFVVLLTPRWISSDYCRNEFTLFETVESARRSGGYIVPIYARDIEGQAQFLRMSRKCSWSGSNVSSISKSLRRILHGLPPMKELC